MADTNWAALTLRVRPDARARWDAAAEARGLSLTRFAIEALDAYSETDPSDSPSAQYEDRISALDAACRAAIEDGVVAAGGVAPLAAKVGVHPDQLSRFRGGGVLWKHLEALARELGVTVP